jgi:hypothetical protein
MTVKNEIQPVEIDGKESSGVNEKRRLLVESHWNYTDRVHLKFGDLSLLVIAEDLERAISNAKNHR